MFDNVKISTKLVALFLVIGVLPLAVAATVSYLEARSAFSRQDQTAAEGQSAAVEQISRSIESISAVTC